MYKRYDGKSTVKIMLEENAFGVDGYFPAGSVVDLLNYWPKSIGNSMHISDGANEDTVDMVKFIVVGEE